MDNNPAAVQQELNNFLEETALLLDDIENLPIQTAVELFDMYDNAAKIGAHHRAELDPSLRVQICAERDNILERIVDDMPPLSTTLKSIYTPAIKNYARWRNVELLKDCGLVVYLLGRELGLKPFMLFGKEGDEFPYKEVLEGLEVICTADDPDDIGVYCTHLFDHHKEMDALSLYGIYPYTPAYLNMYRQLRPDGKVYLALDQNRHWMERIPWGDEMVKKFAAQCDIIATSCALIRDKLNANPDVSFPCHWIANGFYKPAGIPVRADASKKENIILTAGQIGLEQKNNMELMVAFAIAADALPGWTLRLVGNIEPDFMPQIDAFFEKCPDMKERIIFTGAITDKAELYKEYERAKIFALTSTFECGTPNVYGEALFHGCMFVTSDIDGASDVTKNGELGMSYTLGDVETLAACLAKLGQYADKAAMEKHIPRALEYANKYYDWNRIAKKVAYILFRC